MAYIQRTQTGGNRKTFTLSFWVKRANVTDEQCFFSISNGGSYMQLKFNAAEQLEYNDGPSTIRFVTTRLFRDPAAWMHICIKYNSTESTEADRFKMFINGTQETTFGTATYPGLNTDSQININTGVLRIGVDQSTTGTYYGEMSHVQLVDGTALDATSFGEVDATSGIWKIKTTAYATPGTNGFFLKMEDRTNLDLDSSSNAFTFTTSGTLTASYDNPSDYFCTLNPLHLDNITKTNGNTTATTAADAVWRSTYSTLGDEVGKYYYEAKCVTQGTYTGIGFATIDNMQAVNGNNNFLTTGGYGYVEDGRKNNQSTESAYGTSYTTGDIIGVAFNMTDGNMWFSKNGTWQNSATIGEIAANTTTNAAFAGITTGKTYIPAARFYNSTVWSFNFGNGYFGTTAITSAGTNASSIGSFEYDVPTGYTALSTKGLNE
jgi:hypothetical protein